MQSGIVILKTLNPNPDEGDGYEYRICRVNNINDMYSERSDIVPAPNSDFILDNFCESVIYTDLNSAWDAAELIEEDYPDTTEGVVLINLFSNLYYHNL